MLLLLWRHVRREYERTAGDAASITATAARSAHFSRSEIIELDETVDSGARVIDALRTSSDFNLVDAIAARQVDFDRDAGEPADVDAFIQAHVVRQRGTGETVDAQAHALRTVQMARQASETVELALWVERVLELNRNLVVSAPAGEFVERRAELHRSVQEMIDIVATAIRRRQTRAQPLRLRLTAQEAVILTLSSLSAGTRRPDDEFH